MRVPAAGMPDVPEIPEVQSSTPCKIARTAVSPRPAWIVPVTLVSGF